MCGICGIWSPRDQATADPAEAARLMFFSLYALQHRGQESAGMAATDGRDLRVVRRMGLVGQVFSEPDLAVLTGRAAMGHTRYSTTGASKIQNAQPFTVRAEELGELAIAHNGNCINAREIRDELAGDGVHFVTSSDTEVVAQAIVHAPGKTWDERIVHALPTLVGAWSLVLLTPTALYAIRDPLGVRPLSLGRKGGSWLVASETCAIDTIGAQFVRDVAPGEVLRIDDRGPVTIGIDDVQCQRIVVNGTAHGRALRARVLDHVLQELAHGLEQQHGHLVLERLGDAVVLHGHDQALLLGDPIGQPAQRLE